MARNYFVLIPPRVNPQLERRFCRYCPCPNHWVQVVYLSAHSSQADFITQSSGEDGCYSNTKTCRAWKLKVWIYWKTDKPQRYIRNSHLHRSRLPWMKQEWIRLRTDSLSDQMYKVGDWRFIRCDHAPEAVSREYGSTASLRFFVKALSKVLLRHICMEV